MSKQPRSSRQRYRAFVQDYTQRRLDDGTAGESQPLDRGKRRAYVRDYLRWLRPYRYAAGALLALALLTTGLQMIEPLFMRFIVDRVLLNARLDTAARLARLNLAGAAFLGVIILSNLADALRDYRQRLLNVRVMLSLRRSLFQRLLRLPLPKLWDMKTGGILSRLTGDVETTTGLLQMAIVSPAVSLIRLAVAVTVLLALNWRLALTALAIVPAAMLISFIAARRVRPIYRSLRKDVEQIDGRVGEAFSGIRVVRAFRRELQELLTYMVGRHTVLRKELFAHRRELVLWTSWGLLQAGVNVVIVWYGGYMNIAGGASIGDIMAFQWHSFLLLGLVARFHDPTRGRILLNGVDIRDLRLRSYRELLAIVQQDVFLFDGSVRENIAYGRHQATNAEIEDAARRANAHEFIVRLPEQYETFIGERGVKLSGGQQQRLAIARAILGRPQILILDDATSNLDTESEQLIQASMATLLAGRTTFVIAHRLSTIHRADLILLMEDGRVIERGSHDELISVSGAYYGMVRRQMDSHGRDEEVLRC